MTIYRHRDHTLLLGYQGKVTSHALLRTLFKHFIRKCAGYYWLRDVSLGAERAGGLFWK